MKGRGVLSLSAYITQSILSSAIAHGLNAVFADTRDRELVDAIITAELLLGKSVYCDSYLEAARQSQAGNMTTKV